MANQLKMAQIQTILTLHVRGWSCRRIAREVGVDRATVARHVRLWRASNSAKALTGSPGTDEGPKPAGALDGSGSDGAAVRPGAQRGTASISVGERSEKVAGFEKALTGSAADENGSNPATEEGGTDISNSARALIGSQDGLAQPPADLPSPVDALVEACSADRVTGLVALEGVGPDPAALMDQAPAGPGLARGTPSQCEPMREVILAKLELGLSAQRIHQDLTAEGHTCSYHSVRRFIRRLRRVHELPYRRMECAPGEESQVDFGGGASIQSADGRRRRSHVLRVVLSFSRKGYSEAVWRQSTDDFIRCLENAFWSWGGATRIVRIDNLRAAVKQADWYDPELNPKIQSFCRHYGITILPTRPYTPRHKGKVERAVAYVKANALKGHTFTGLQAENDHLRAWEATVADKRIHGTTRQQVGKLFTEVEKPALLPLPVCRFDCFQESKRVVHRDGHVEVAKAYYSVPPEHLGQEVWVRWDGRVVRIFDPRMQQIALHSQQEPGRFSTHSEHIAPEKISAIERGTVWLLKRAEDIGPHSVNWARQMLAARGIEGVRVLMGLTSLAHRYAPDQIERACEIAASHGAWRLRVIRALIKHTAPKQQQLEFVAEDPIIRPLSDYEQIVRSAFTAGGA